MRGPRRSEPVSRDTRTVRLLLVDEGEYRVEEIQVPADALGRYDRLIDLLQEEPEVLRTLYVDLARLCSAQIVTE